jgi:outer membrane receptor protein involved in Fe transport
MYHYEGQLNLSEKVKVVDVLVGASFRRYSLNSNGTIFADTAGRIGISEYGGYLQLQKRLLNDVLKLTVSGRYDKNQNFKGRFTPRATALIRIVPDNNLRLSFQTAYRFPSTQDQYINLLTGGVNRLIGGLPQFNTFFKFDTSPGYTAESVAAFRAGGNNPALLKTAVFTGIKPETMNSYEIGYRGLISKKLLIDVYGYYSQYKDFLARVAVGRGQSASTNPLVSYTELASPFTTSNYSFITNSTSTVKAYGWGLSAEYQMGGNYIFNLNVSSDELTDVPPGLITFFNTPKYRFNIGLGNANVSNGIGFNVMYRWQDQVIWEGTFGTGPVDAYGTVDAQVSYRFPKTTNMLKIGASNVLNNYYRSAFGNPSVGGLYYASFGFNVF